MDNNNDTAEFLFEAKNVRNEFVSKAQNDWWLRIGVERVVFEDILIMYDQMITRLAALQSVTLVEEKEPEAIEFAEWINNNYALVHSLELKKSAWINFTENEVLTHGSDYHYTTLINEVGKTTAELYELFKNSKQ